MEMTVESLTHAMATPGDYELRVPEPHNFDKVVSMLRRMAEANGFVPVTTVYASARIVFVNVKERTQ